MAKANAILITIFSIVTTITLSAQNIELLKYAEMVTPDKQKIYITYLADDLLQGRATGTQGNLLAGQLIYRKFKELGMTPLYGKNMFEIFRSDKVKGRNIAGIVRSRNYSDRYIIVSAHYDHLGIIGDKLYNGADDNASGVSALLTLAEMFSKMKQEKMNLRKNILFIAFDAKENNLAGSKHFISNSNISANDIECDINIDQIGSTIAPPHKDSSYILIISPKNGKAAFLKEKIERAKFRYGIKIDTDYSFYNSPEFAEIFYKASDQYSFAEKGVPSILVTAGINEHCYKPTDDPSIINYEVLAKRIKLLFYTICELAM